MRSLILLIGTSALVAGALTGCSASGSTAAKDVTITACTPSPTGGHPTATGRIVNHSSKSSLYTIHVKFTDSAGNGVGDGLLVSGASGSIGAGPFRGDRFRRPHRAVTRRARLQLPRRTGPG